jgi:competence protein ComEC
MARAFTSKGPWSSLARAPIARIVVPFALGCAVIGWYTPALTTTLVFAIIGLIAFLFFDLRSTDHSWRWRRGVSLAIWMFAFGLLWSVLRQPGTSPNNIGHHIGDEGPWLVRLQGINRLTEKQLRADAEVIARHDGQEWQGTRGSIMLTALRSPGDPPFVVGDRLLVRAPMKKIQRIPDPGGFDRQVWAAARGIEMELFATRGQFHQFDHASTWVDPFAAMRARISSWVDEAGLTERSQALVKALVLGQRDELDSEQKTAFARSGTVHVLAVSGMHVGIIYLILSMPFKLLGERRSVRIVRGLFVLIGLWTYAGITGGAPSIVRAALMFSLLTVADMFRYRTDGLNSLAAAMFFLLIYDPSDLWNIGFQLSFLAVLGIVVLYQPLASLWVPRSKILRLFWSLAVVSIAAQAFTTPVSIYYFKAFPILFLPANLIVVLAATLAVYLSVAMLLLQSIPMITAPIKWCLQFILDLVADTTSWFASFPDAYPAIRMDLAMVIVLYLVIVTIIGYWYWRWEALRYMVVASLLALVLLWGGTARRNNSSNVLTLYDERSGVMASITVGRRMIVTATPDKDWHSAYTARKIQQHQNSKGITTVDLLAWDRITASDITNKELALSVNGRWKSEHFDLLFISDPQKPITTPANKLDAVVIHDLSFVPEEFLERISALADRVILAGKNDGRTRYKVADWCRNRNIPFHDIFAQGAFILRR